MTLKLSVRMYKHILIHEYYKKTENPLPVNGHELLSYKKNLNRHNQLHSFSRSRA